MELSAKIVSSVNLKALTILEKRYILDASVSLECAFAGENNVVIKIQTEISPWQQVKME